MTEPELSRYLCTLSASDVLSVRCPDGTIREVGLDSIARSEPLRNSIKLDESESIVVAPCGYFEAWLDATSFSIDDVRHLPPDGVFEKIRQKLVKNIKAADFFADQEMLTLTAMLLGTTMFLRERDWGGVGAASLEALSKACAHMTFQELTDDLGILVLKEAAYSLDWKIRHLPPEVHHLATFAAFPKLQVHKSLQLHWNRYLTDTLLAILSTYATLTTPHRLDITDCTLPTFYEHPGVLESTLLLALGTDPEEVALDDFLLNGEHCKSLLDMLATNTRLRKLRISGWDPRGHWEGTVGDAIAEGLSQDATGLRSLALQTIQLGSNADERLPAALKRLTLLTELRLGPLTAKYGASEEDAMLLEDMQLEIGESLDEGDGEGEGDGGSAAGAESAAAPGAVADEEVASEDLAVQEQGTSAGSSADAGSPAGAEEQGEVEDAHFDEASDGGAAGAGPPPPAPAPAPAAEEEQQGGDGGLADQDEDPDEDEIDLDALTVDEREVSHDLCLVKPEVLAAFLPSLVNLAHLDTFVSIRTLEAAEAFSVVLQSLSKLTHLALHGARVYSAHSMRVPDLTALSRLRVLDLPMAFTREDDVYAIADGVRCMPELEELAVHVLDATEGTVEVVRAISETAPHFKRLTLKACRIWYHTAVLGAELRSALAGLQSLQQLHLRLVTVTERLAGVGGQRAQPLLAQLPCLTRLQLEEVDLAGCSVPFWEGLGALTALQVLHVEMVMSESLEQPPEEVVDAQCALCASLSRLQSLHTLRLRRFKLSVPAAQALGPAVAKLSHLTHLNLQRVSNSKVALKAVYQSLQQIPSLKRLDLGWHNMYCMNTLAAALPALTGLQSLRISHMRSRSGALRSLAPGLAELKSLEELEVSNMMIDKKSGPAFAAALTRLSGLQRLTLHYNWLEGEDTCRIMHSVGLIGSLTRVEMGKNYMSEDSWEDAMKLLQRCGNLRSIRLPDLYTRWPPPPSPLA